MTQYLNKHLLNVYDKPMVLYPLDTLKSLGIEDILIVSGGDHIGSFMEFLGDGSKYGVNLTYRVQTEANGIAGALLLAEDFAGNDGIAVILGDNIFEDISQMEIPKGVGMEGAFFLFAHVSDPKRFGVPVFGIGGTISLIGIEEKPVKPQSEYAVTGFYIYPPTVFEVIKTQLPSARGEYEITDTNNFYINSKKCAYAFHEGFWHDAGTHDSLLDSSIWAREHAKK
jgi:glucose-1-phosphate thymidylyltransferase